VQSALNNEPITIYGDGTQSRVFCHVLDAIDAVLKITKDDATIGEVFNVGGEGETTIQQLAEKIIANTNSQSALTLPPTTRHTQQALKICSAEFQISPRPKMLLIGSQPEI
jgi:UDP-glucose 4-epimerase